MIPHLPLSDLRLHGFPFLLQAGEILLRIAVRALGRSGEQLGAFVEQLSIQLLLGLKGRTQLLKQK